MKTTIITIIVLIIVGFLGYSVYSKNHPAGTSEAEKSPRSSAQGTIAIAFTDDTAAIQNVNEIKLEVDKVQVYSETEGWVEVSDRDIEYKLLELKAKGQSKIYATAKVAADTYTQTKVTVKKVAVQTKTAGEKAATMPSNEIIINGDVNVEEDKTSSVHIDVLADQSLHTTTKGEYVFAPVIVMETKSDVGIIVASDETVTLSGGETTSSSQVGMDLDGSVKTDFKLSGLVNINIQATSTSQTGTTSKGVIDATINGVIR